MLTVAKFGGSSTANANQFKKIKEIIDNDSKRKVIIVSALGKEKQDDSKITDLLFLLYAHLKYSVDYETVFNLIKSRFIDIKNSLDLDYDIESEFNDLEAELNSSISEDYLASRGEYFTAKLLSEYLNIPFVDATDLIFFNYDGSINETKTKNEIVNQFKNNKQMIIPGFYGAFPGGNVKLFTRGGSDVTGSIIAKFLEATLYENWTDVNGIYMADPRIVKDPLRINEVTYDELRELSYMGANVLHEETIFPLQELGIPIQILNTNFPNSGGTTILKDCHEDNQIMTGIAGKKNFVSFSVTKTSYSSKIDVIRSILDIFQKYNVNIEHMPSGIDSFSIVTDSKQVKSCYFDLIGEINNLKDVLRVDVENDIAVIAVVGRNMGDKPGIAGFLFNALGKDSINIKIIAQASLELSIIIAVENQDFEKTINTIYSSFIKKTK